MHPCVQSLTFHYIDVSSMHAVMYLVFLVHIIHCLNIHSSAKDPEPGSMSRQVTSLSENSLMMSLPDHAGYINCAFSLFDQFLIHAIH